MSELKELEIALNIIKQTNEIVLQADLDNEKKAFFRDSIRKNIFFLQEELLTQYSETVSKFVVFPLLAYVDEKIMFKYEQQETDFNWNLLQFEYYQRKDGGEYVFEIIDDLLSDEIYPQICYKVVYFVLKSGFLGKYYDNQYDRDFLPYSKKISSIINKEDYKNVSFQDANKALKPKRRSNFIRNSILKLIIPLTIFGISILCFIY